MSAWLAVVRDLSALGGEATLTQIAAQRPLMWGANFERIGGALQLAKSKGLTVCNGRGLKAATSWRLTELGHDFMSGRVVEREARSHDVHGRYWSATWLRSLPEGVRVVPSLPMLVALAVQLGGKGGAA